MVSAQGRRRNHFRENLFGQELCEESNTLVLSVLGGVTIGIDGGFGFLVVILQLWSTDQAVRLPCRRVHGDAGCGSRVDGLKLGEKQWLREVVPKVSLG